MKPDKFSYKMINAIFDNLIFRFRKHKYKFRPVFIIGCGRSGTTILGKTLSLHPKIKFLNDRRNLWHKAYPEFDVWSGNYSNPKMFANENDNDSRKTELLRNLFFKQQVLGKSEILLEKLPINNICLKFLQKSFPDAKFIYLHRNGLEVSRSIEKKTNEGKWFGKNDSRFKLLLKFAKNKNANLEQFISSNLHKGMFEWRLSIDESDSFFKNLESDKFTHLSYQDFIQNTSGSIKNIFDFLGLEYSEELIKKLSEDIKLKNSSIKETEDVYLKDIGGEILTNTINNCYSPQ